MSKAPRRSIKASPPCDRATAKRTDDSGATGMSSAETAQYVAEFSAELSYLARRAQLVLLAYLLDMARLEAIRAVQSDERDR